MVMRTKMIVISRGGGGGRFGGNTGGDFSFFDGRGGSSGLFVAVPHFLLDFFPDGFRVNHALSLSFFLSVSFSFGNKERWRMRFGVERVCWLA